MAPTSEIHIQSTDTDPVVQAQTAIGDHHEQLRTKLATLAGAVTLAETAGSEAAPSARTELREFATGELRNWLAAGDEALYAPASGSAGTRLLVQALRVSAAALDRYIDALATADDDALAESAARSLTSSLDLHLTIEQSVLLPALAELPGADLPGCLADLTTLLSGGQLEHPEVVDVREIPHGERHPRIFARYARLAPGESFTLVNNHDPKPLRREFEAAHPGAFSWDYVESGPQRWQIRIGRTANDA